MSVLPATDLTMLRIAKGDVLFHEGDAGDAAYIVDSGAIGIFKAFEGGRIRLATLRDGELFGEMAIIDGSPRMADAVALENSVVLKIPRDVFESKLRQYDPFLRGLVQVLVHNLRNVHRAYMRRPRSVQDFVAVLAKHADGLRRYLAMLQEMDPDAEALKHLDTLEDAIGDLKNMFSDRHDRRKSVLTDSDL
ncbi:MAG: hypothetical protein A3J29_17390 [Acidobacteria bacterium RIFCSPLOWO2_12_FULL_67_14b]|nr:MAG: hypothetical protein A3J29_17390 [Acidobacteria bacterium RIFCSPLOWO2_12_FULL_67_14b]